MNYPSHRKKQHHKTIIINKETNDYSRRSAWLFAVDYRMMMMMMMEEHKNDWPFMADPYEAGERDNKNWINQRLLEQKLASSCKYFAKMSFNGESERKKRQQMIERIA